MDIYPLDLILTVATASATIFLGFLPTKSVSSAFFARETAKAILAWGLVALLSPFQTLHFPLIFACLCGIACWHFRANRTLDGKMWLSLASGLGISVGVLLILAVTPQAYPLGLPELIASLLLASIYLGGAIIGLAYTCFALVRTSNGGVTQGLIQRSVGLLLVLTLVHSVIIVLSAWYSAWGRKSGRFLLPQYPKQSHDSFIWIYFDSLNYLLAGLVFLVMPFLAFCALRNARYSSRVQPTRALIAFILFSFFSEILARLFVY